MAEPSNIASRVSIPPPSSAKAPVDDHNPAKDAHPSRTPGAKISDLNKRLLDAASDNNAQKAWKCLREGADINATGEQGVTSLLIASREGFVGLTKLLLQPGISKEPANIEAKTKDGKTALHLACWNGRDEVVSILIENRAQIDAKDNDDWSPLHNAADHGHVRVIRLLLDHGANLEAKTIADEYTPLMVAITEERMEAVEALLVHNVAVDMPGVYDTPLTMACRMESEESVRILLKHDADVNLSDPDKWWPLHSACRYSTVTIVGIVLQSGPDINVKAPDGWTPLHFAARYGEQEMVKSILERNPDVDSVTSDGLTPLHVAIRYGNRDVVHLILEKNTNIHAKDSEGWTPLHTAARNSKPGVLSMILEKKPDINATDYDDWTALHLAVRYRNIEIVTKILDENPEIDASDNEGFTALHKASRCRKAKDRAGIAELLLEKGAKFLLTKEKKTPLHRASEVGCVAVVEVYLRHTDKFDINALEINGWTALHLASFKGFGKVVDALLNKGTSFDIKTGDDNQTSLVLSIKGLNNLPRGDSDIEYKTEHQATEKPTEQAADQTEQHIETQITGQPEEIRQDQPSLQAEHQTDIKEESEEESEEDSEDEEEEGTQDLEERLEDYKLAIQLLAQKKVELDPTTEALRNLNSRKGLEIAIKGLQKAGNSDLEKANLEQIRLVWYAMRSDEHENLRLLLQGSIVETKKPETLLQWAAYRGNFAVVWWLLQTSDPHNQLKSTTNRQDRDKAIQIVNEKLKTSNVPKSRETTAQYSLPKKEEARYSHTLDILQDPPLVIGRKFESGPCEAPKLGKNSAKGNITQQHKVTIVDFYSHDERVDLLRRSLSLHDVIYNTEKDGPAKFMEKATELLKSVGREETSQLDLVQRLLFDQKKPKTDHADLRDFLRRSWPEVPSGDSETKFMKPNFLERFSKKPTPTPSSERPDTEIYRNQKIDDSKPTKTTEEPGTNYNGDNAMPESQPPVPLTTSQTDRDKSKSEPAKGIDEDDNTAALYIPYLTFEKCFEANEASEDDISVQAGNQEMDLQKDNFRAKYQHFMDTYNGKRQVVQGSRSLDQFYYQALPDMKLRDADQVVTRYLLDKDRGDKTKNVISSSTLRPDELEDRVVEGIFEHLRERNNRGGGQLPPSSALDLAKLIVNFCINFTHTINWSLVVLGVDEDKKYPRLMEKTGEGGREKTREKNEDHEDKENRRKDRFLKSPCEIFAETINQTAVDENDLFTRFVKKVKDKKDGNGTSPKEKHNEESSVDSEEQKDWKAIYNAALLLEEVKDIRDELNVIKTVLTQQKVVWEGLLGQEGQVSQAMKSRMGTERNLADILEEIIEMDKIAETIQTSVKETLDLEQNGINITEAVLSRDLAKQSARQGTTLMVFTVVTIFFLPMSFLASLFALNVTSFQHNSQGNVQFAPEFIFPIIFCVSIALGIFIIYISFNYKSVQDNWEKLRQFSQGKTEYGHSATNKQTSETETPSNQIHSEKTVSVLMQSQDDMLQRLWKVAMRKKAGRQNHDRELNL
ncbi:hypothetical protein N7494_006227 [Penicillium frequentans]|uniref:Ankyrin repeat protein n=1 Tax=Penicillium frequentans TaxID=3151616 RepID=A0AAD6CXB2_9EURO|nr:hypothetical protein N7494_006227 [Penicillium glabrum]